MYCAKKKPLAHLDKKRQPTFCMQFYDWRHVPAGCPWLASVSEPGAARKTGTLLHRSRRHTDTRRIIFSVRNINTYTDHRRLMVIIVTKDAANCRSSDALPVCFNAISSMFAVQRPHYMPQWSSIVNTSFVSDSSTWYPDIRSSPSQKSPPGRQLPIKRGGSFVLASYVLVAVEVRESWGSADPQKVKKDFCRSGEIV